MCTEYFRRLSKGATHPIRSSNFGGGANQAITRREGQVHNGNFGKIAKSYRKLQLQ